MNISKNCCGKFASSANDIAVKGLNHDKCTLVKVCFYELADRFGYKYEGTGIIKGQWCYLKSNDLCNSSKKNVTGKYFKVIEVIEEYPLEFDIEQWQTEGESNLVRNSMSRGQALFALDEDVDKEDVLHRLLVNNEVLLADVSYIAGYNSSYHHENMVELVSDKCYLRNGSKKKINAKWIKITKVYNGFPKDYEFYHTKLS